MARPRIETFARNVRPETTASVRSASASKTTARRETLSHLFEDVDAARTKAAEIKDDVLENLSGYFEQFIRKCEGNGIRVHHAVNAEEARSIIVGLCCQASLGEESPDRHSDGGGIESAPIDIEEGGSPRNQAEFRSLLRRDDVPGDSEANPGTGEGRPVIAKAKSMATEEIHLNPALEAAGFQPVETDLGEYVVQIDGDRPSHIVTPIIHKSRFEVARSFEREGLGPYSEDPAELTLQARAALRENFREAVVGISGVNFGIAETGRLVLVENEGNNRFSTTAPKVHIALMGIEKILPKEADLPLFLKLLAGSATGQRFATYIHLITGPKQPDETDGPEEVHLVLLDNGRSKILESKFREVLRCIRCGACLNVCPVYRQAGGHAYRHVYSGPIGAVLAPLLEGLDAMGDLAKASSLCGACEEVCPVKIPLPEMLLELRDEAVRTGAIKDDVPWNRFAQGATSPFLWRTGLMLLPLAEKVSPPGIEGWTEMREAPKQVGRSFRKWWDDR